MKSTTQTKTIVAVLSVQVIQMGCLGLSPALADIAEAFPSASASAIQFLMNFPSILVIVSSIVAGLLSRHVPRRFLAAFGCACYWVSGILAFLFHGSLPILFVWGVLTGIGIGVSIPVTLAAVNDSVSEDRRGRTMGWVVTMSNLGAMLMNIVGGYLTLIHWSYDFLVYLIVFPGMILSLLFLPSAPEQPQEERPDRASGGTLALLKDPIVLLGCLTVLVSTTVFNVLPSNLSMLVSERVAGTSAQAGLASSLVLLSGTIIGLFYGRMSKRMGHYIIVFGFCMMAIGEIICAVAPNILIVYLGCLIAGMSHGLNVAQVLMITGRHSHGMSSLATALVTASGNLGGFFTPFLTILARWISGDGLTSARFLLSGVLAAVIALAIAIIVTGRRRRTSIAAA